MNLQMEKEALAKVVWDQQVTRNKVWWWHKLGTVAKRDFPLLHAIGCDCNRPLIDIAAGLATIRKLARQVNTSAFKGSNERLSGVDTCKDEGHSDASSIKRVTSSSEGDCFLFTIEKGSLSAATKSRI
jgi:hypothetical protein